MDAGTIAGVVSAAIAVIGGAVTIGRWSVGRARRRKSEKVTEERRIQRARRVAAVRPKKRRSDGGWVFKGTGISPRNWMDRWR
jgi:hypothetical protein